MSATRPVKSPSSSHNNADLLVWACFIAGGYERWLDVEELYLKAFALGSNRLSWRTRPDLADYKKCAKALQELEDEKRSDHLGLFLKQGKYQRKLSNDGLKWCQQYGSILTKLYTGSVVPSAVTQEPHKMIRILEKTEAFQHFQRSGDVSTELWQLAESLQCMVDSVQAIWTSRLDALSSYAGTNGRVDVERFVLLVRERLTLR